MRDLHFGSLNHRELTLRPFPSSAATVWNGHGFAFSWAKMLKPRTWLRMLFREKWAFEWWGHRSCNHRCYCPGTLFDGRLVVAGFGVCWFFSVYHGPIPCPCDEVIAELFPEYADDE